METRDRSSYPESPHPGHGHPSDWIAKPYSIMSIGIVLFILIFGIAIFLGYRQFETTRHNALTADKTTANLLAELILEHNKATIEILQSYAHRSTFIDAVKNKNLTSAYRYLSDLKKNANIDRIFITDKRGILWVNFPVSPESIGKDLSNRDWYKGISFHWKPYISTVFKLIVGDTPLAVAFCVPVFDEKGRPIGILSSSKRLDILNDTIERVPFSPYSIVNVIDQAGTILYSNRHSYRETITEYPHLLMLERAMKDKRQQIEDTRHKDLGKSYLSVIPVGDIGWTVVIERLQRDIYRSDLRRFIEIGAISFLLFLLIFFLLVYLRKAALFRKTEELLQAETKLRQGDERLRALSSRHEAILAAVSEIIMEVDNNKVYTWANSAGIEFFGEDVIGKEAAFYFEGEQSTYDTVSLLINGAKDIIYVESWQRRRDGQKRLLAWWCRELKDEKGRVTGALSSARDITERREIEVGLEKTRKELEAIKKTADEVSEFAENIINTVREPLIALNQDLRVVKVSSSFCDFFKVSPEETVGQLIYDLGNKQWDVPKLRELLETILPEKATFDNYEIEHDFSIIGRRTMLLNARQIIRVLGKERIILLAIEDITDHKRLENLLTEAEELYRGVFDTASDGIVLLEKREGKITHANSVVEKMLGYSAKECIGNKLQDIGFMLVMGDFQTAMQNLNKNGFISYTDVQVTTKSGQHMDTDIYLVDKPTAVQCNIRDIAARRLAEDKLRITQFAVDCAAEPIGWMGKDGRHLYVNDAYCRLLDYSKDEFLTLKIYDLDPEVSAKSWLDRWEKIKQQDLYVLETSHRSKNGVLIPLEIHANYLAHGDEEFIVTFCRDIRERKLHEEHLKRQIDRLAALRAIDMAITASLDIRVTFSVFLEQVIACLGVDAADVLLIESQAHNRLSFVAGRGFRTNALRHTKLLIGEGYAGRAVQERKPLCIPDLQKEPNALLQQSPHLSSENFVTYHAVPLIAKGYVRGVLELFNRTPFEHDQDWLDFLDTLAGQAAIAIDNALLFDDLQNSNIELIHAYDSTLEGWSRALDLRDKETEGHSKRVTEMTLRLARQMGMTDSEQMQVRRGALLHDIGKMGIPDGILLKPGTLSDAEWEIMRKHPVYAYELLYPISHLRPALDIPYCHHEKWDGTGYPRGLKGEYIPLSARIFSVVDVWDALCSDRPYRPAWPEEKTREYIKELSGKQFDPKVVEGFFELLNG